MKKFTVLILSFSLLSIQCKQIDKMFGKNKLFFEVTNLDTKTYDDVKVYSCYSRDEKYRFDSLSFSINPQEIKSFTWEDPILKKSDGEFLIKAGDLEKYFGYYTNNALMQSEEVTVTIKEDEIIVRTKVVD
tara:strand:+ start:15 stop:407 length:393 start_codon:yes stop_codon:yes gene_type:complete